MRSGWLYIHLIHYIHTLENIKSFKSPYAWPDFVGLEKYSKALRDFRSKLECIIWADWCLPSHQGFSTAQDWVMWRVILDSSFQSNIGPFAFPRNSLMKLERRFIIYPWLSFGCIFGEAVKLWWKQALCLCRNHEERKILFGLSSTESTWNLTVEIGKLRTHTIMYPNKCAGKLL